MMSLMTSHMTSYGLNNEGFPTKHQLKLKIAPASSVDYSSCDTYMYVYRQTCIYVCTYIHISHMHVYIQVYVFMHISIHIQIYI